MDARTVIRAICALPGRQTQAQGDYIAALFQGDFDLFRDLDEGPGRYLSSYYHGGDDKSYTYDDWHYKLRRARNGCDRFFDILNNPPELHGVFAVTDTEDRPGHLLAYRIGPFCGWGEAQDRWLTVDDVRRRGVVKIDGHIVRFYEVRGIEDPKYRMGDLAHPVSQPKVKANNNPAGVADAV